MLTNLQEGQSVDSGIEIPRLGRSPDFDHRCPALPGLPVVFTGQLPYTVTASLRIHTGFPFHPPLGGHPDATILYFFRRLHYSTGRKIVNTANRRFPGVFLRKNRQFFPPVADCFKTVLTFGPGYAILVAANGRRCVFMTIRRRLARSNLVMILIPVAIAAVLLLLGGVAKDEAARTTISKSRFPRACSSHA